MLENKSDLNKLKVSLLHEEKSKKAKKSKKRFFWILSNLTIGRYLCFQKHYRRNLSTYLNIYSRESIFLLKGKNDDSEKFKGLSKTGGFDYIPCEGFSWQ